MLNKETNLKNKGIPKLYLAGAGVGPGRRGGSHFSAGAEAAVLFGQAWQT